MQIEMKRGRKPIPLEEIQRRVNEEWVTLSAPTRCHYKRILAGKCINCGGKPKEPGERRCFRCALQNLERVRRANWRA